MSIFPDVPEFDNTGKLATIITHTNVKNYSNVLRYCCSHNSISCVKYLISIGMDVNNHDHHRSTALHYASTHGRTECVRLLIDAGARVDRCDGSGETPLHDAISHNNVMVTKILIDRGASIHNVHLVGNHLKIIPQWIPKFISARHGIRRKALIIIGICKFNRITNLNGKDVIRHISKHIWSTRLI
jgi:ankyrin repeat protein